jgi:predicted TPR repeat methyltransferase
VKSETENVGPSSADDVLDLLDSYVEATAVGAALEYGLFWAIDRTPLSEAEAARRLGIPLNRCQYWLQCLTQLGLVEPGPSGFSPTQKARAAILDAYSQGSWALLARESREQLGFFQHLSLLLKDQRPDREALGLGAPDYVERMNQDAARAREFTRMLFELHGPLAEAVADALDLGHIKTLMDLGGGSGVMSMALLRRFEHLNAVVVDIPNVCLAGQELVAPYSLQDRLRFHAADFGQDELPKGFDMVLECDVGVYNEDLYLKIRSVLNPGGRYIIVDQLATLSGRAPQSRIAWALRGSLEDPLYSYPTVEEVVAGLKRTGFHAVSCQQLKLASGTTRRFSDDLNLIDARI